MSDEANSKEFREDVQRVVRKHDPDADSLRDLAADLESLADRYEATEEIL